MLAVRLSLVEQGDGLQTSALAILGNEQTFVYDGSWTEWGQVVRL